MVLDVPITFYSSFDRGYILIQCLFLAIPLCAVFTEPTMAELKERVRILLFLTIRKVANQIASFLKSRIQANADPETLLDRKIDLDEIAIDAAPFQLVVGSSLYKVHSLFSLLGLSHAYVTDRGKLIGVMGLKEVGEKG